ncbi:hypothetical protein DES43_14913 [Aquamicrobium defluvii]|uniref:Uncharacterized protein n=1 Tax=Aquamicrobium defluvii TaxID=69279 RepID=A0A4R6Y532_9HYPH|nr:hypothetical protein DES43_14913 [Aquamicrobium defluvii]
MLETSDRAQRRGRHRQFDLIVRAGAHQHGGIAISVFAKPFPTIFEFEAAKRRDHDVAVLLKLDEGEDLLHQCATSELAIHKSLIPYVHAEGRAGGRHQPVDVLPDLANAACRIFDIALGVADLPANGELIILMCGAQSLEPGNIGFEPCLLHQTRIA